MNALPAPMELHRGVRAIRDEYDRLDNAQVRSKDDAFRLLAHAQMKLLFQREDDAQSLMLAMRAQTPADAAAQLAQANVLLDFLEGELSSHDRKRFCDMVRRAVCSTLTVLMPVAGMKLADLVGDYEAERIERAVPMSEAAEIIESPDTAGERP